MEFDMWMQARDCLEPSQEMGRKRVGISGLGSWERSGLHLRSCPRPCK